MTAHAPTPAQLDRFGAALKLRRGAMVSELARLDGSMLTVRESRGDGVADDEHDPEGPTMSSEWSRLTGTREALERDLAAVERSLTRLGEGRYGFCARCGKRISTARLEARPEAELCIDCASAAEQG
ncbi:TraR/DksA C4-type zinc finger protein [Rathayibacter sp. YIM 133350]|uniref:TraR/DksA family transcriptional regulator n=1 Tax=Rathayibacter sp. YIM 133350 TaxID=3131992 RepID=UPI00307EDE91